MILFVWSLFAGAIGYVKRQKLAQAIYMNLARPGSLMFHRLVQTSARSISVPTVSSGSSVVCRGDRIEIVFRENSNQLDLKQWHCFDLIQHKLQSIAESPVYFVATMTPGVEDQNNIRRAVEERCIPIAWRTEDNLEVLFGSNEAEFVNLICDWADNLILYRNFFDLTKLETVLLSIDFKNSLIFIPQSPKMVTTVDVQSPAHQQSPTLKGLELSCLKDILGAKDLCKSIATFSTPEKTTTNNSSQSNTPQSPTLSIVQQQPTSMPPVHSTSTFSIPCKFSPIEEVPATSSHQDISITVNETFLHHNGRVSEADLVNFDDDIAPGDYYRRRSPCHGFNDRLVDRNFYHTSRSSSLSSVITEEPRRSSRKKQAKSSLNISENYSSISRRFSLPSPQNARSRSNSSNVKFRRLSMTMNREKPPNILIYCGADDSSKQSTLFEKLRNSLHRSLNRSKYVVYRLKHENFLKDPWPANTTCLVLADFTNLDEKFWTKLFEYFRSGGKLLFVCENRLLSSLSDTNSAKKRFGLLKLAFDGHSVGTAVNKEVEKFLKKLSKSLNSRRVCEQCHVKDADGRYKYTLSVLRETNSPLIFYMQNSHERAGALFSDMTIEMFLNDGSELIKQILERLGLEIEKSSNNLDLSRGYLIFENQNCLSLEIEKRLLLKGNVDGKLKLDFKEVFVDGVKATESYMPVVCSVNETNYPKEFNCEEYFSNLKSVTLGKSVLFASVATSTMIVYDSLSRALPNESSFIVIAKQQTGGQGRSGNQWLSPVGCAVFTLGYQCSLSTKIGQHSGYLQHIVAVSVVDSICKLPSFETFDLHLKWPNDIYYGRTVKIGGVLINSVVQGDKIRFNIGVGFNVANSAPTACINDVLPDSMEPFSCERVIALIVSRLEELLDTFNAEGHESIWPLYYKYWLHDRQELTLYDTNETINVRGLDKYGFLEVRSRQSGKVFSLQPDGNSLDMMHNLIKMKT